MDDLFHLMLLFLKDIDEAEDLSYMPLIVARFGDISMDSLFTDQKKFNQISIQVIFSHRLHNLSGGMISYVFAC